MTQALNESALAQCVEDMRPALREYAALVHRLAGADLAGLTVFGAVLGPDFDPSHMAAAGVMVLHQDDLKLLRQLAEHGPALGRRHISAPLVMTPLYIAASLDTFPLELLEIHQRHATLLGEDHFASLEFAAGHMRLQCEREFKRILIQLRQGLLAAAGREKVLGDLVSAVGQHLLRTLRGLLWLKGKTDPLPRDAVLTEIETLVGKPLPGVRAALQPYGQRGWAEFAALYHDVDSLASLTDVL